MHSENIVMIKSSGLLSMSEIYNRLPEINRTRLYDCRIKGSLRAVRRIGTFDGYVYCKFLDRPVPPGELEEYDDPDIYWLLSDVVELERNGEATCSTVITSGLEANSLAEKLEYFPAEVLRREMGKSPIQMVRYLREVPLDIYGVYSTDADFFVTTDLLTASGMLPKIKIHKADILAAVDMFPELLPFVDGEHEMSSEKHTTQLIVQDARIAALEKELSEAKAQLSATPALASDVEPATTVNATKWENSVVAAFEVWAEIIQGSRTDWKEPEFKAALSARCEDWHTKVLDIAWRALPDSFKHGRGRPKKNTEKSQHPDNT